VSYNIFSSAHSVITEQRPEEVGLVDITSLSSVKTEGTTVFNASYIAPTATEIIMDRDGER
jgi:hypothetical protein